MSKYKAFVFIFIIACFNVLCSCGIEKNDNEKVGDIDYVIVKEQDLPKELLKLINEKKANTLRMAYSNSEYTYIVAGFGTLPTNGYGIRIDEIYLTQNGVYVEFTLIGPTAGSPITELPTTPVIVLRIDKTDRYITIKM